MKYLTGYPKSLLAQVRQLMSEDRLGEHLRQRYPQRHEVRSDRSLFDYVQDLKTAHLRSSEPLSKVCFDNRLHVIRNALGTHSSVSRVQGGKLKAKREIRIASLFKNTPPEFLKMIVVHELAHLRQGEHDKAFYQLCRHMAPDYHQLELDVRLYLMHLDAGGAPLWGGG